MSKLAISPAFSFLRWFIAGGLFVASFWLYLTTLAPSVVTLFDDSLEFQLVTYQLGLAHPTGYPLYTLLGKLFTFLPVGNVAYRVNLMSAVFGAATVALLYLLIVQLSEPHSREQVSAWIPDWKTHLGGIIGASLLAVGPIFGGQATLAEVYTLNAFFVVALLLIVVTTPPFLAEERGRLGWLAFMVGLSLTHHRTSVLLWPALGLYLYFNQKSGFYKKAGFYRTLVWAILSGLIPLLLYLYLPLRGHIGSLDGTYQNTWAGFWRQVSAGGYGVFIFGNPFEQERDFAFYWQLFTAQFYTLIPGFLGLFYLLWRGQRKFLVLTGVTFLTYLTFNLFYQVADIEVFFIPPILIWAAWSGVGVIFLLQLVAGGVWRQGIAVFLTVVILTFFAFIIFQFVQVNWFELKARYTWQVHDYGLDVLQQPLPKRSAIVGILGEMTLLRYFQQTEQRRPDVETIAADKEVDRLITVEKLLAEGKAVYLTRELPGVAERWSLGAEGPLIRVNPEPVTRPPQFAVGINRPVTPQITLLGYNVSRPPHTGEGPIPLRLTLFWQATAPLTTSLKVSARLLNAVGEVATAADAVPVHFAYPTTAWRPGEIIADVYDLTPPVGGQYTPLLIWYNPAQNAAEVGRVELTPVE